LLFRGSAEPTEGTIAVIIRGKQIILRAIEHSDLPVLHTWSNDPEIQENLGSWHFPASLKDIERWAGAFRNDTTDQRFMIETNEHGPIGLANLVDINWKDRNAFHGMLLASRWRGLGFGFDTVMTVMRYAFEELGLERLDTSIIEYNEASYQLYVGKCGWIEEGRKKSAYFRRGRYWSKLMVGITREDYLELRESPRVIDWLRR
jgi:RimJ/RimL family protein N-acetyltransferase